MPQVAMEGIQLGTPEEWVDPNAEALHDSPGDSEALLGARFHSSGSKQSNAAPLEQ